MDDEKQPGHFSAGLLCLSLAQCDEYHGSAFGVFVEIRLDRVRNVLFAIPTAVVDNLHDMLTHFGEQFLRILRRDKASCDDLGFMK